MKKKILSGILLTLFLISPAVSWSETPSPVPSEQARHSDDLGQSSTVLATQVSTYEQLVAAIRQARAASQARVEQAIQQEKVREAWETGRLIDEHVLQHKERADYGTQVILRLSGDLSISETQLYAMLQFARDYPISLPAGKLSWSHYEALLPLNDIKERDAVAAIAEKENWTRDQVREELKKRKAEKSGTLAPVSIQEMPLTAKLGKPGTYKFVKATVGPETGKGVIDLGFSNYYRTSRDLRFKEGAILEVIPAFPEGASAPSDLIKLSKRTAEDLFTYRAWVVDVLDGDTVKAVIDLGFGVRSVQVLRLRGLDAPELVSREGKEAKAFLEQRLRSTEAEKQEKSLPLVSGLSASPVLIRTVKSDKYDRYLADIFIDNRPKTADRSQSEVSSPQSGFIYVNQELVAKGHAVKVQS